MLYPAELPGRWLKDSLSSTGKAPVSAGTADPARAAGWGKNGGAEEDRTPDLCIANAALSQLSYRPMINNQS